MIELKAFWDSYYRIWSLIVVDENDYQVYEPQYCANKSILVEMLEKC